MHRLMLESQLHNDMSFVTLTYDDEHLPKGSTLVPEHPQRFIKRLRKRSPKLRYFLVGEYGTETHRPHYHVAFFGYPNCTYVQSRYSRSRTNCCVACDTIRDTWSMGQVFLGTLSPESMGYVAGYVTKKMTNKDDPRLDGRHPEFARMSNRPGIGHDAMHELASESMRYDVVAKLGDVPSVLRHGTRLLPLGRYLRNTVRKMQGLEPNASPQTLQVQKEKLQTLRQTAWNAEKSLLETYQEELGSSEAKAYSREKLKGKKGHL